MVSRQQMMVRDVLQSAPTALFLFLWRGDFGLEFAGWCGSALALSVLVWCRAAKIPAHPILLGANIHLLLATPVIVGLDRAGAVSLSDLLAQYGHPGVLITVMLTGLWLTFFSRAGFIGDDLMPKRQSVAYSCALLVVCALGIVWAFAIAAPGVMAVALPFIALIGVRGWLLARWQDRAGCMSSGAVLAGHDDLSGHLQTI